VLPAEDTDLINRVTSRLAELNLAASTAPTSSSSSASGKALPPRPKAKANPPKLKAKRYYTIYGLSHHPDYCGVHHGLFDSLKTTILGGELLGSGASLRGFDTEQEALDFWYSKTREDVTVTEI
jgi:hypothetical protein